MSAGGEYSYAVSAVNAAGESDRSAPVVVSAGDPEPPPPPEPVVLDLLASGSQWSYEASGNETAGWSQTTFDDSVWPAGPSQLGHGEGDEATEITPFMENGNRRITTYFRTSFDIPNADAVTELDMQFKLDDGMILYLNGTEVLRDNMPADGVDDRTLSTTWAPDDGQSWRTGSLPVSGLRTGRNVIAVELHQNSTWSRDLTWDMRLQATSVG